MKDIEELLKYCSIIIKALFKTLSKPGKLINVTDNFIKDDLYPICGFLGKDLKQCLKKTIKKHRDSVGPAVDHLEKAEKAAHLYVILQKKGAEKRINPVEQMKAETDALFDCRNEIGDAFEHLEEFCPEEE